MPVVAHPWPSSAARRSASSPSAVGQGPPAQLFRDHALREIVGALEVAALTDGELAARPQRRGDPLHHAEVPPSLARASLPLHVHGAERSFVANAAAEIARDLGMLADEVAPPGMAAELAAAELERGIQGQGDPARLVAPIFEDAAPPAAAAPRPRVASSPSRRESSTIVWLRAPATETVSSWR